MHNEEIYLFSFFNKYFFEKNHQNRSKYEVFLNFSEDSNINSLAIYNMISIYSTMFLLKNKDAIL